MILTKLLVSITALTLTTQVTAVSSQLAVNWGDAALGNPQDTAYVKQRSEGEVTLEVWPKWQDGMLVVEIRANTHSVDLSGVNLREQVRLMVDDTEVTPIEAGSLSGHHAVATLVFRLEKRPDRFAIQIRDVPDVPLRLLNWPAAQPASQ